MNPDSSWLLDSHRVVCPEGSGGGNRAREHIFNPVKLCYTTLKTHHQLASETLKLTARDTFYPRMAKS